MKKLISILVSISVGYAATANFIQNPNWTILPNQVNFSGDPTGTPTATAISGAPTANGAANGAYDQNNNMLFYVNGNTVFTPASTVVGTLPVTTENQGLGTFDYSVAGNQIVIVPVPGTCESFYVIYPTLINLNPSTANNLMFTIVTCTGGAGGTVSMSASGVQSGTANVINTPNTYGIGVLGGYPVSTGIAVSRIVSGSGATAIRNLYWVTENAVFQYTISASGIAPYASNPQIATLSNTEENGTISEVKLDYTSSQSLYLAWGNGNGHLCVLTLPGGPTTTPSYYSVPGGGNINGLEFDPYGNIYLSTGGGGSGAGIYRWNLSSSSFTTTPLSGSSSYGYTQIETSYGYNTYTVGSGLIAVNTMYAVSSSGKLGVINPYTGYNNTITASPLTSITVGSTIPGTLGSPIFTLPSQVDGDSYSYFFGVPLPTSAFSITSDGVTTAASAASCSSPIQVYDCGDIALTNQCTSANTYTLAVNSLNSSCDAISGSGYLTYSSGSISSLPTDLRAMPGTNGTWLASHPGLYKVTITVTSLCGETSTQSAIINVNAAPAGVTPSSSVFTINNPNSGNPCFSSSQSTPCTLCSGSPTMNISSSTGTITYYSKTVYEYVGGVWGTTPVYSSGTIATSGVSGLTSIYVTTSGFSYSLGTLYEVVVTVGNACGSSTSTCYVEYAMCKNAGSDGIAATDGSIDWLRVYPVPMEATTALHIYMSTPEVVSACLTDMEGRAVQVLADRQSMPDGENVLRINTAALQPGVYIYKVSAGSNNYTGRIVKPE